METDRMVPVVRTKLAADLRPRELTTFVVRGNAWSQFPFDMLRYDQCWPTTSADASAMKGISVHGDAGDGTRCVQLATYGINKPTVQRWDSFGWTVIT